MVKQSCNHDYNISAHLCLKKKWRPGSRKFLGTKYDSSPKERKKSFLCTLWYLLTLHFGLRGCQEHHEMFVEDFTLNEDVQGTEYITFEENPSKTRYVSLIFWCLTTASTTKIFKNDFHLTFPCCLLDF